MSIMHRAIATALRAAGWHCFPPAPLPPVTFRWEPTRGIAALRTVTGAGAWGVQYVADGELQPVACSAGSWARCRTKTQARETGA